VPSKMPKILKIVSYLFINTKFPCVFGLDGIYLECAVEVELIAALKFSF